MTAKTALFLLITLIFLSGCSLAEPPPTPLLIRPADTPVIPTRATAAQPLAEEAPAATAETAVLPPGNNAPPTATPLPTVPGAGLRPDQASLLRPVDTGLETAVDWRPPPVPVPHALNPDDHYWLSRPIPSGFRNYDLEWYPYGIEPMLASALPYRIHHGMDFPNETGTPILAADGGTVIWAGPRTSARNGVNYYGNTVIIQHDWQWQGKNVYTLYAHTLELFVEVGDQVERGQLIAGVGGTGEVSGPHLHLEIRIGNNNYGSTRNPSLWLAPYEGWGTLAGRFVDVRGRMVRGALVTVRPENVNTNIRQQRTYFEGTINSDEVWQENFVVADLPAGRYTVEITAGGYRYEQEVTVRPGQTNFIEIQADFAFTIAATPHPTFTPAPEPVDTPEPPGAPEDNHAAAPTPAP